MRVLVVEDAEKVAHLLARGLREQGFAVDVSGTGDEAVWLAGEHDYDAIVLDVMLPDIDGFEVCRRLRTAHRWAPVLMLTALDAVDDRVHGLDAGADDYLTKHPEPTPLGELLDGAAALFRAQAANAGVSIRVDAPDVVATLDRARLRQAVDDLIDNALRHARAEIVLRAATDTARGEVAIVVEDDGPGFSETRPASNGGDGFGLVIVRAIAEAHGGTVHVGDGDGGARVELTLPLAPR